ncbi:unnamed protein product [Fraxinus pennsylvanica]|uniref:Uncharacterized protein n=1 Tax=Fraxinus pennsylvanica TaxID=56036 RepID=A0AAD2E6Q1_9LAMI|nr:unnamed protein product [Fraxinus pennsylvanica]
MESAMVKASGQVERAYFVVHRLHVENAALRQEMEAAKLHVEESDSSYQEFPSFDQINLPIFVSFLAEYVIFNRNVVTSQAQRNQEENAKEELLAQASSFRNERE